jgi:hypothetical protein
LRGVASARESALRLVQLSTINSASAVADAVVLQTSIAEAVALIFFLCQSKAMGKGLLQKIYLHRYIYTRYQLGTILTLAFSNALLNGHALGILARTIDESIWVAVLETSRVDERLEVRQAGWEFDIPSLGLAN